MSSLSKQELRVRCLQLRQEMSREQVTLLSNRIQSRLIESHHWPHAGKIGLYSPIKNEVQTHILFQKALEQGLQVYFPRVEQGLSFYEVNGPDDLQRGAWGILEPSDHCEILMPDEKLDVLVIPGIAFDDEGYRLGYGKGFYDRVLEQVTHKTYGLGYTLQVVTEVPKDEWDQPLNLLVTDELIIEF